MASEYEQHFIWPHSNAQTVVVTGTFDNWSSSVKLEKGAKGFEKIVSLPWSSKVVFKFIVDGRWVTSDKFATERDNAGNMNNTIHTPFKPAATETASPVATGPAPGAAAFRPTVGLDSVGVEAPAAATNAAVTVISAIADSVQSGVNAFANAAQAFSESMVDQSAVTPMTEFTQAQKGPAAILSAKAQENVSIARAGVTSNTSTTESISASVQSGVSAVADAAQAFSEKFVDQSAATPSENGTADVASSMAQKNVSTAQAKATSATDSTKATLSPPSVPVTEQVTALAYKAAETISGKAAETVASAQNLIAEITPTQPLTATVQDAIGSARMATSDHAPSTAQVTTKAQEAAEVIKAKAADTVEAAQGVLAEAPPAVQPAAAHVAEALETSKVAPADVIPSSEQATTTAQNAVESAKTTVVANASAAQGALAQAPPSVEPVAAQSSKALDTVKTDTATEKSVAPETPALPTSKPTSPGSPSIQMPILSLGHPIEPSPSATSAASTLDTVVVPGASVEPVAQPAPNAIPAEQPSTHAPINLSASRKSSHIASPAASPSLEKAPPVLAAEPTIAPTVLVEAAKVTEEPKFVEVPKTTETPAAPVQAPKVTEEDKSVEASKTESAAQPTVAPIVPAEPPKVVEVTKTAAITSTESESEKTPVATTIPLPATPATPAKATSNGNGKAVPPTSLPPATNGKTSPSAPSTPIKNGGAFPSAAQPSTPGSVRSTSSSHFGNGSVRKKRESFFGKIKDIFSGDKDEEQKKKEKKNRRQSSLAS